MLLFPKRLKRSSWFKLWPVFKVSQWTNLPKVNSSRSANKVNRVTWRLIVIYETVCCRDMTDGDKMSCSSTPTTLQETECASSSDHVRTRWATAAFQTRQAWNVNGSSLWFLDEILTFLSTWSELSFSPLYCDLKAWCIALPVFCCIPTIWMCEWQCHCKPSQESVAEY